MRRRTLVFGALVLSGATLLLFCCAGSDRSAVQPTTGPATTASPASTASDNATAPVDSAASPQAAPAAPASASAAAAASGAPKGPGGRIAEAVQTSDPRDSKLLSSIERELQRDPPPEIHALIGMRKRGAKRDELARAIQGLSELRLRVLAGRWLDEVAPLIDAGPHP